jgi:hypothetical protein
MQFPPEWTPTSFLGSLTLSPHSSWNDHFKMRVWMGHILPTLKPVSAFSFLLAQVISTVFNAPQVWSLVTSSSSIGPAHPFLPCAEWHWPVHRPQAQAAFWACNVLFCGCHLPPLSPLPNLSLLIFQILAQNQFFPDSPYTESFSSLPVPISKHISWSNIMVCINKLHAHYTVIWLISVFRLWAPRSWLGLPSTTFPHLAQCLVHLRHKPAPSDQMHA